jgi:hypothetical protein
MPNSKTIMTILAVVIIYDQFLKTTVDGLFKTDETV